jgi:BMFP domain-containing protein YqiC
MLKKVALRVAMTAHVATLVEPTDEIALLEERVAELEDQLERERARNAGLTQGIEALSARVAAENARLRGHG